ncbi:MAG TPA: T9SS type A sorting domain-containing protein [Candidatus Kapabacteria bacterium]|nr:T9SS type A sorting domain-containing protein [Candidatus Kapabacteria bacterium]
MRNRFIVFILLVIGLTILRSEANAQWLQTNGPYPGGAMSIAGNGVNIFVGTSSGGVFRSTDDGLHWSFESIGLPSTLLPINSLVLHGTDLFAGTYNGNVFLSSDYGTSWTLINNGLPYQYVGEVVNDLAFIGTDFFAATDSGLYRSVDSGLHWARMMDGMPNTGIEMIASNGSNYFAATDSGIYYSSDSGSSWTASGLKDTMIRAIVSIGTDMYAGTENSGVFRSIDNGMTWLPTGNLPNDLVINTLLTYGTNIFIGSAYNGVFLSKDNGMNWLPVDDGLGDSFIHSLYISDNFLFAGSGYSGVWRRPLSELITAVNEQAMNVPADMQLSQNYPNPFRGTTNIEFRLPNNSNVTLSVYNALGEEIATLVNGNEDLGEHNTTFNAENLQSGIYFYRLMAGKFSQTGKMTVIK